MSAHRILLTPTILALGLLGTSQGLAASTQLSHLSTGEQTEIKNRIEAFYEHPRNAAVMKRPPTHYGVSGNRGIELPPPEESLSSEDLFRLRCETIIKKAYPDVDCSAPFASWSLAPREESLSTLAESWIAGDKLVSHLDYIPLSGRTAGNPWSGSYWRYQWGGIAHRYADRTYYDSFAEAKKSYSQPDEWLGLLSNLARGAGLGAIARTVAGWSPAEKYDLLMGDTAFGLTTQQWGIAEHHAQTSPGDPNDIPAWYGLCHGWAAASVMMREPVGPVRAVGAQGVPIRLYPSDLKALGTAYWANGNYQVNLVGGKCNAESAETFPNGRIRDQECFDVTPVLFHSALGNFVGRHGISFLMDESHQSTVWNYPVRSYTIRYFNPLYPGSYTTRWQEAVAPYDWRFKRRDRFQYPLTRGVRTSAGYDDSMIRGVVGVVATVEYTATTSPVSGPRDGRNVVKRVNYIYDLELYQWRDWLYPGGGEWHANSHPDFLWLPRRGSVPTPPQRLGVKAVAFDPARQPVQNTTTMARRASKGGVPLCEVVDGLWRSSAGESAVRCR